MEVGLIREVRQAFKAICRQPGSTIAIIAVLTLAIAASTVVFSLVDVVMLRTLGVKDPGGLVLFRWRTLEEPASQVADVSRGYLADSSFSYASLTLIASSNDVLTNVIGFAPMNSGGWFVKDEIKINGHDTSVFGQLVTPNYFSMLGVRPKLGQLFTQGECAPGQSNVAVISHRSWVRDFGSRASAVGSVVYVEATPYTIIGVTPDEFQGTVQGLPVDLWISISQWPERASLTAVPTHWWLSILGRIKPGVSLARAQVELRARFRASISSTWSSQSSPREFPTLDIVPGERGLNLAEPLLSRALEVLSAIAILLILMTCANVSTLMLARATARKKEIAIRVALGAGIMRLGRQFLFESSILGVSGGILGLIFAILLSRSLIPLIAGLITPFGLRLPPADISWPVILFASGAVVFTAVFFCVLLVLYVRSFETTTGLHISSGLQCRSTSRFGMKEALVVAQISICAIAFLGSGLLVQTFANLERAPLGFDPHGVLQFSLNPAEHGLKSAAELAAAYGDILARIQSIKSPMVESASISSVPFFPDVASEMTMAVMFQGHEERSMSDQWSRVAVDLVGPDFFRTMKIGALRGRVITLGDVLFGQKIAVVNQSLAEQFFNGENAVGKRFGFGARSYPFEIIGVVQNVKDSDITGKFSPIIYIPYSTLQPLLQSLNEGMYFDIRTNGPPAKTLATLRLLIDQVSPSLRPRHVATIEEELSNHLAQERIMAWLSGLLSFIVLVLGCTSLYGVQSQATAQRRHEIGIRIALGAQRNQILSMILKRAIMLACLGVVIGVPIAVALARFIRNQLYGIKTMDPVTITVVVWVLLLVGLCGGYLPAKKAMCLEPMTVLREE